MQRERGRRGEGGGPEGRPPLMPFRQPVIPLEQESGMQERAWRRTRGEAARPAERDREVAAREHRVREEEEAVARGAHWVLLDPEGDTPSTDVDGRSASGKRAKEEEEEAWQERGKRRRGGGGGEQGEQRGRRGLPAPARS